MTTAQDQQRRAEFEAWIRTESGHPFAGQFTNLMWKSWQAARALPVKGVDPMLETPAGLELASGQCRFTGEAVWRDCSAEHVSLVLSTPNEWEGYEVRYLYADPRSQDRRPPVSLTTPQLQKLGRWLAAPSDLDGDQPVPRE